MYGRCKERKTYYICIQLQTCFTLLKLTFHHRNISARTSFGLNDFSMRGEGEGGEAGGFAGLAEGAGVGADLFGGDVEAGMGTGGNGEFLAEGDEVALAIAEGGDF